MTDTFFSFFPCCVPHNTGTILNTTSILSRLLFILLFQLSVTTSITSPPKYFNQYFKDKCWTVLIDSVYHDRYRSTQIGGAFTYHRPHDSLSEIDRMWRFMLFFSSCLDHVSLARRSGLTARPWPACSYYTRTKMETEKYLSTWILKTKTFSLGQGMMAARPSTK